jgi:hypothetical protein
LAAAVALEVGEEVEAATEVVVAAVGVVAT